MIGQIKDNLEAFVTIYESKLWNIDKVRILPLNTSDFSETLQNVIKKGNNEKVAATSKLAEEIKENLCEDLIQDKSKYKFIFNSNNNMKVNIYDDKLKTAISKTLENGTIPAMYVNMDGNIFLDESKVGQVVYDNGATKNQPISTEHMITIMKKEFIKTIKNLKGQM